MNLGSEIEHRREPDMVVGVDGSESSTKALIWAMTLAASLGWTIEVVTAWPESEAVLVHEVPGHFSAPRHHATLTQKAAIAHARREVNRQPTLAGHIVNARPVEALCARAQHARVIVVGARNAGRAGDRRGRAPIEETLSLLSRCPVVVVRADGTEAPISITGASLPDLFLAHTGATLIS